MSHSLHRSHDKINQVPLRRPPPPHFSHNARDKKSGLERLGTTTMMLTNLYILYTIHIKGLCTGKTSLREVVLCNTSSKDLDCAFDLCDFHDI